MSKFIELETTAQFGYTTKPIMINLDNIISIQPDESMDQSGKRISCSLIKFRDGRAIQVTKKYVDLVLALP